MATSKIQNDYGMLKPFTRAANLASNGTTSASITVEGYTMLYFVIGNGSTADYEGKFVPIDILKQRHDMAFVMYDGINDQRYVTAKYNTSTEKVDVTLGGDPTFSGSVYIA